MEEEPLKSSTEEIVETKIDETKTQEIVETTTEFVEEEPLKSSTEEIVETTTEFVEEEPLESSPEEIVKTTTEFVEEEPLKSSTEEIVETKKETTTQEIPYKTTTEKNPFEKQQPIKTKEFKYELSYSAKIENELANKAVLYYTVRVKSVSNPRDGLKFLSEIKDDDGVWDEHTFHLFKDKENKNITNIS